MDDRRKFLIVTYFYAPNISARAFRWSALAEQWAAQGHQVDVVCGWEPGLAHEETLRGVRVHRVNFMLTEKLRGSLKTVDTRGKSQSSESVRPLNGAWVKGKVAAIARWAFHNVYKKLYWPDGGFLWRGPALQRALTLAADEQHETLISVSPHFTAHLVGVAIHRRFPQMRWLVDIGDPFSFLDVESHNNRLLYGVLNSRVERNIFHQADIISVTTQPTRDTYARLFPESASKTHIIPPMLSIPEVSENGQRIFPQDDKIRLVFVGVLYTSIRPPDFLLKLFGTLQTSLLAERLELHFFGDARQVYVAFQPYNDLLNRKIFLHGTVSRDQVTQAMYEANVLVNIGNKTFYQLPSKVVEYAHTGKPILNIAQIKNDSSAAFFETYPAAITLCDENEQEFAQEVNRLYNFLDKLPPPVSLETIRQFLAPFRLESVAAAYDELVVHPTEKANLDAR